MVGQQKRKRGRLPKDSSPGSGRREQSPRVIAAGETTRVQSFNVDTPGERSTSSDQSNISFTSEFFTRWNDKSHSRAMRRSTEDLPEFIPADGKSRPLSEDEYSEITLGESEVEELSWLKLNYPRGGLKPENLISSLEGFEQEHLNLYAFTAALNSKNHAWAVEHWRWQQVRGASLDEFSSLEKHVRKDARIDKEAFTKMFRAEKSFRHIAQSQLKKGLVHTAYHALKAQADILAAMIATPAGRQQLERLMWPHERVSEVFDELESLQTQIVSPGPRIQSSGSLERPDSECPNCSRQSSGDAERTPQLMETLIKDTLKRPEDLAGFPSLDSVVGHHQILKKLRTVSDVLWNRGEKGNTSIKNILLYGPQGNGKSMLAKACAKFIGANFFEVKSCHMMHRFVGDVEKCLAALFIAAKIHQPCVVFIDEIDGLIRQGPMDTGVESHLLTSFKVELTQLTECEAKVLIIGTTNNPSSIDAIDGLARRFYHKYHVAMPDVDSRAKIIRAYVNGPKAWKITLSDDELHNLAVAAEGMSCSDIESCLEDLWEEFVDEAPRGPREASVNRPLLNALRAAVRFGLRTVSNDEIERHINYERSKRAKLQVEPAPGSSTDTSAKNLADASKNAATKTAGNIYISNLTIARHNTSFNNIFSEPSPSSRVTKHHYDGDQQRHKNRNHLAKIPKRNHDSRRQSLSPEAESPIPADQSWEDGNSHYDH